MVRTAPCCSRILSTDRRSGEGCEGSLASDPHWLRVPQTANRASLGISAGERAGLGECGGSPERLRWFRWQRCGSPATFTCDPYACCGYKNPKDGPLGVVSCCIS